MSSRIIRRSAFSALFLSLLGCCSPEPANHVGSEHFFSREKALATARSMIGRPYKYRGENPTGFDCSGLVRFSYLAAGLEVPHSTVELKELTHRVATREMNRGDLVFFERERKNLLHVGIYAGGNQFVHAPRPGTSVRIDSLLDPYWKRRFLGARRF